MTPALWTLAPVSVLIGALLMWAFRRMADREALRAAANRIQAHLLEFWLFVDEPALVWKSWGGLLWANARFLRLLLVPLVVLSIPATPLFFFLDAVYGSSPLRVGEPAVVTLKFSQPPDRLELKAPDGISVESPPVYVTGEREVSWRIRPLRPLSGTLVWTLAGSKVEKSVAAGTGPRFVSRKRTRSPLELVQYPTEALLGAGRIDWIEVSYPYASVAFLGLQTHWAVWFLAFSLLGAALLPGRLE
ncbi:MAG: hypothetical protein Q8N47_24505 [Bryobacterales bacterium]|nr:hypothetical protein [Bryobacterales bacterium]